MKKIFDEIKKEPFKYIFFIVGFSFILIFFLVLLLTHGETLKNYIHAYPQDHFQDFFNSMNDTIGRHPYQNKVIYPPLCYVIYCIFLRFIPLNQLFNSNSMSLRLYQGPMFGFLIYFIVTFLAFIYLIKKMKKGNELEKNLFLVLITFSLPFLFEFERANIIFISLLLLMFFFIFKDSKNKVLKELSLISLAASAAIKIYPAIFGLILLREKKYKEIFRVIIYGLILFFVPFLLFGGFGEVIQFYKNLINTTNQFSEEVFMHRLNFTAYTDFLTRTFSLENSIFPLIFKVLYIFVIFISCINSLVTKCDWKRVLLLTLLMIITPGISFTYTAIFLVIPIIMLLDDKNKKTKIDYVYLVLLILVMFPNPVAIFEKGDVWHFIKNLSWNSIIMSTSIMLMTFILNIEIIINVIKESKGKKNECKQK